MTTTTARGPFSEPVTPTPEFARPDQAPPTALAADGTTTLTRYPGQFVIYAANLRQARSRVAAAGLYLDAAALAEDLPGVTRPARPSRASELVMNPDNDAAAVRRRARLLETFDALPADIRADLLEAAEDLAGTFSGRYEPERIAARRIIERIYVDAGWGTIIDGRYHENRPGEEQA